MRWIDLPPVWLLGGLVVTWASPWQVPWGPNATIGSGLILIGIVVTLAAIIEFGRSKTSIIPRQDPNALITSGIFRFSRNPIYLADVLILIGVTIYSGKWLGFLLVPLFVWLLHHRFIRGEEAKLQDAFGDSFKAYASRVRRWL